MTESNHQRGCLQDEKHIKVANTLSNHKFGKDRDSSILRLIESQTVLNTDQIRLLFFRDVSVQMACRRLQRLTQTKRLKRDRHSMSEPYFYYRDKKPGQLDHALGVSWVYTWLSINLKTWEKLHSFEREVPGYGILRPDGFAAVKNIWQSSFRFFFIEFDIAESGNRFNKHLLYNNLYSSEGYTSSWWASLARRFPPVIIVTTGKKERIIERIRGNNENNLEFQVYTLDQIREECFEWHKQQPKLSGRIVRDS